MRTIFGEAVLLIGMTGVLIFAFITESMAPSRLDENGVPMRRFGGKASSRKNRRSKTSNNKTRHR